MNILKVFAVLVAFAFSHIASAVTMGVVPGKEVGKNDTMYQVPYWAGMLVLNIDGVEMPAMSTIPIPPTSEGYIECGDCALYTYSDVLGGNPAVAFGSAEYSMGIILFRMALSGGYYPHILNGADTSPFLASINEMQWMVMWDALAGENVKKLVDPEIPITYLDAYHNSIRPQLVTNFDWSESGIRILASPSRQIGPLMVETSPLAMGQIGQVPIPNAVLLFGSGLIGLATVARRRKNKTTY